MFVLIAATKIEDINTELLTILEVSETLKSAVESESNVLAMEVNQQVAVDAKKNSVERRKRDKAWEREQIAFFQRIYENLNERLFDELLAYDNSFLEDCF